MRSKIKKIKSNGFSTLELTLIIITIVAVVVVAAVIYQGITKKAAISDVQADLTDASSILMSDKSATGSFPLSLTIANHGKGITSRPGVEYQYEVNNTTTPKTFCITAAKDSNGYKVANGGVPTAGSCTGYHAMMYLDAGNSLSYNAASTIWSDMSGHKNDLTLLNGVGYDSQNGGALIFDGVDDYAQKDVKGAFISDPALNNYKLSFSFWVNVLSSNSYYIISSGSQTASSGISFSYQAGGPFYSIRGATKRVSSDVGDFPLNVWTNWTVTSDGTNSYLYKNGALQSSTAFIAGGGEAKYTDLTIGTPNNTKGKYMSNMKFASLVIYDRTLTAKEVQQNFDSSRSRYGI